MMSNIPQARTRLRAVCDDLERFWPKGTRKATAALIRQIIADDMHKAAATKKPDPVLVEEAAPGKTVWEGGNL